MARPSFYEERPRAGALTSYLSPSGSTTYVSSYETEVNWYPVGIDNPRRANNTRQPSPYRGEFYRTRIGYNSRTTQTQPDGALYARSEQQCCGPYNVNAANSLSDEAAVSVLNNARIAALAGAVESSKSFNAALLQANGTLGSIRRAATAFVDGADSLMRGRRGLLKRFGAMANWRKIPGAYLEFCYSWQPLGDDVVNAVNTLGDMLGRGYTYDMLLKKRLKRIETQWRTPDGSGLKCHGWGSQASFATWVGRRQIDARVCYLYSIPESVSSRGVPALTPFSSALELLPYSFVLDWFLPFGPWVQALEAAQYSPFFREGSETVASRVTLGPQSGRADQQLTPAGYPLDYVADCDALSFKWNRSVLYSAPTVVMTRPALKPFPGIEKVGQALSLLSGAFASWIRGKPLRDY